MTEEEWDACTCPDSMLAEVKRAGKVIQRKARLFACACLRRRRDLLIDPGSRVAVEAMELRADGLGLKRDFKRARDDPRKTASRAAGDDPVQLPFLLLRNGTPPASFYKQCREVFGSAEATPQAALVKVIFGNLCRPVLPLAPSVLAWQGGIVASLAEAAYEHRSLPSGHLESDRLAILADALEDAGCATTWLLEHLRSAGPHVRGCFAVDAVLGRE